jgi:hypothetical protein
MTANELARRSIPVFANNANASFDELRSALSGAGMSNDEAGAVLEFVPLAFGRAFLDGMGIEFADYYIRLDDKGKERQRKKLVSEALYFEAVMLAPQVMLTNGQEAFTAVAIRSAEVQAINNALNQGVDPNGLVASPPVMMWGGGDSGGDAKPWWKFW